MIICKNYGMQFKKACCLRCVGFCALGETRAMCLARNKNLDCRGTKYAARFFNSCLLFSIYDEIRDTRVYISPVLLPLCAWVSRTYAVRLDPSCALSLRVFTFFHIWFPQNQIFQYPILISTPSHPPFHDQISPRVEEDGDSGYVNPVI